MSEKPLANSDVEMAKTTLMDNGFSEEEAETAIAIRASGPPNDEARVVWLRRIAHDRAVKELGSNAPPKAVEAREEFYYSLLTNSLASLLVGVPLTAVSTAAGVVASQLLSSRGPDNAKSPQPAAPYRQFIWPMEEHDARAYKPGAASSIHIYVQRSTANARAAADGVVIAAATRQHQGHRVFLIRIEHTDGFATVYNALGELANGINNGSKVKQGQPIAVVQMDSRGVSVLAFDTFRNGQPINPLSYLPQFPSVLRRE